MRFLLSIVIAVLPLVTFGQIPFSLQDRAFITSTSPLRNGLVGYWRLEESSGTRYDRSKNGNHLTDNNSVGQASGVSSVTGNCATFVSGSSQRLSISSTPSLVITGAMSFTAWVYPTNKASAKFVMAKANGTTFDEYALYVNPAVADNWRCLIGNGSAVAATTFGAVQLNTWQFLAMTFDGTTLALSVNAGSANTAARSMVSSNLVFAVGSEGSGSGYFSGKIDEVGLWNRAITTDEITQLYNAGLGTHFPWAHP